MIEPDSAASLLGSCTCGRCLHQATAGSTIVYFFEILLWHYWRQRRHWRSAHLAQIFAEHMEQRRVELGGSEDDHAHFDVKTDERGEIRFPRPTGGVDLLWISSTHVGLC